MAQIAVKLPEVTHFPLVKEFLESKARNSRDTADAYRHGLQRLASFLAEEYPAYDIQTILKAKKLDIYKLIDRFISHMTNKGLGVSTVKLAVAAARAYLQRNDIDILPAKFRNKVTMPKERKEDEYPIDIKEIRQILTAINNRRLKALCVILASGGMRPLEALAIQYKNLDLSTKPTKIYMKAEYSKNKLPREIYITEEATTFLNQWLAHKYRKRKPDPDEFIFAVMKNATPYGLYPSISHEFRRVLKAVHFDERKPGLARRGKITLYSFRRHVKTVTEDFAGHSMSEYLLGHKKSPYYTKREPERRAIYAKSCERHLTYLDYTIIDKQLESEQDTIKALEERLRNVEIQAIGARRNDYLQFIDFLKQLAEDDSVDEKSSEIKASIQSMFEEAMKRVQKGEHLRKDYGTS
jgi:integrase